MALATDDPLSGPGSGDPASGDSTAGAAAPIQGRLARVAGALNAVIPRNPVLRFLLVVLSVPYLVVAVRGFRTDWTPISDIALEMLRMHDVGTRHTPLVGVFSRFGWSHPGPLFMWLDAPALRLFGPSGVLALTALTNLVWLHLAVAGARRLAGDSFAIATTAGVLLMTAATAPVRLAEPWNPWIAVPALLCFLVNVMAFAEKGAWSSAVIAVVAGSFAVQSHVVTGPLVAAGTVGAVVWMWSARPEVRRPLRLTGLVILIGLALWSGPIVQQVRGPDGNLAALVRYSIQGGDLPAPPLHESLGIAARELGPTSPLLGFDETLGPFMRVQELWTLAIVPVLLIALGLLGRRNPVVLRACAFAVLLHSASIFAVTRTTGGFAPYVVRWSWTSALISLVVLAWGAWRAFDDYRSREGDTADSSVRRVPASVATGIAVAVALAAAIPTTAVALRKPVVDHIQLSTAAAGVIAGLESTLPDDQTFNVRWNDAEGYAAVASSVFSHIARSGRTTLFPGSSALAAGPHRAGDDPNAPTLWVIGSFHGWVPPDGAKLLTHWSPLDPAEQKERDRIEAQLRGELGLRPDEPIDVDALVNDPDRSLAALGERLRTLREHGEDYSVFLTPPVADQAP
ncbi:MAG: hypothetical protein KDB02_01845 [Acidimicrobiales bacterium]|nr:hypothetical protein [Acidimicrobiales bacterium]